MSSNHVHGVAFAAHPDLDEYPDILWAGINAHPRPPLSPDHPAPTVVKRIRPATWLAIAFGPDDHVAANPGTQRQVKRTEAYFNTLPATIPVFDHFTPSAWLLSNMDALASDDPKVLETLGRAEEIFKRLNGLKS